METQNPQTKGELEQKKALLIKQKITAISNSSGFAPEKVQLVHSMLMPEGSNYNELEMFLVQAKRTGLDPFSRQIYASKIQGKLSIQATIDGFRVIASRSEKYQGQTTPLFCDSKGQWSEVWLGEGYPVAAKVGVYHSDFREPLYVVAKWDNYVPINKEKKVAYMWAKMPEVMLAKVAEALALRKAFPNDLGGLYTTEEMEQAQPAIHIPSNQVEDVTLKNLRAEVDKIDNLDDLRTFRNANTGKGAELEEYIIKKAQSIKQNANTTNTDKSTSVQPADANNPSNGAEDSGVVSDKGQETNS